MRQRGPLLLVLLFLAVCCWGCMPDGGPPTGSDGTCNNNGVCEKDTESCLSCPSDCSCCHGYWVAGNHKVSEASNAEGKPDGKFATLSGGGVMIFAMGLAMVNQTGDDFRIIGTIQAGSKGKITVSAKDTLINATGEYKQVGIWMRAGTKKVGFDIGRAQFSGGTSISEIMLEATDGMVAKIDAIESIACQNKL